MATFWSVVRFIMSLPKLLGELGKIWEAVRDGLRQFKQQSLDRKVRDATVEAKETKDTSKLEKHFNPGGGDTVPVSSKVRRRPSKLDS